jgi:hypothetical protein
MTEQNQAEDKVVDIFAGTDKSPEPTQSINNPAPRIATAPTQPYVSTPTPVESPSHKKFYIIAGVAVMVLLLIVAVTVYIKFTDWTECTGAGCNPLENVKQELTDQIDEVVAPSVIIPDNITDTTVQEVIVVNEDTDKDGLTDAEEIVAGTNPVKTDSDSDGLFDFDEVKKFGTDPLNSDTDGDSFLDGEEILGGYNPKGTGKLLNFEAELEKVKAN